MEALLPSEIARLVLGYLEDQNCAEAARLFLETSPHLQECRIVKSSGKRFSTKVCGLNLLDILEKLVTINGIIQDRFNKVAASDQVSHYTDVLEQLKYLIEGTREQRFVVNINVPTQSSSQTSGGSPIISSCMRKRHYSSTEKERCKRNIKLLSSSSNSESTSIQEINDDVGATPLESLPGHVNLNSNQESNNSIVKNKHLDKASSLNDNAISNTKDKNVHFGNENVIKEYDKTLVTDTENNKNGHTKCTTATSTEELYSVSSTEVQTAIDDMPEFDLEPNDEPIENLSLLTKELLNRTELQERIADTINKAILPTDLSFKDESINESTGELNTSIISELNNAIKSIVEATESDPVFEKFLNEIIGPHADTDTTSPDEDEIKSNSKSDVIQNNQVTTFNHTELEQSCTYDNKSSNEDNPVEIPLKHRLRSSSRQQNIRIEDEVEKQKDKEREQNVLEDQNAAAIQSIINVNIINKPEDNNYKIEEVKEMKEIQGGQQVKEVKEVKEISSFQNKDVENLQLVPNKIQNECIQITPMLIDNSKSINSLTIPIIDLEPKIKKAVVKRSRLTKPKTEIATGQALEEDTITIPTLIVCSKNEFHNYLAVHPPYHNTNVPTISSASRSDFIPIAPKEPIPKEPLYLRTVEVPQKCFKKSRQSATNTRNKKIFEANKKLNTLSNIEKHAPSSINAVVNTVNLVENNKLTNTESITLYSNENSANTLLDNASMPTINIDENISLSGASLSPYLKFNYSKPSQSHSLSDIELEPCMEHGKTVMETTTDAINEDNRSVAKSSSSDIISKRTPKSLLKSRSKNHRLSLSTPRRRKGHVRALDFNTPAKVSSSAQKIMENKNIDFSSRLSKRNKGFRTSLFKSPPVTNSKTSIQEVENPLKIYSPYKIPIATRSPVPKLMGGWDNCNGVGVIIGDSITNTSITKKTLDKGKAKRNCGAKSTWDADLRKKLSTIPEQCEYTKTPIQNLNTADQTCSKDNQNLNAKREMSILKIETNVNKESINKVLESSSLKAENSLQHIRSKKQEVIDSKINFDLSMRKAKTTKLCDKNILDTCKDTEIKNNIPAEQVTDFNKPATNVQVASSNVVILDNTKSNNDKNKVIKKYAQLKTIKTNLKKTGGGNIVDEYNSNIELPKISSDLTSHILQLPDITNLETPRKDILTGIPPTPRVLSPSNNIITPFIKIADDNSKIRSFVSTPEFPTTPCIALTPKQIEDNRSVDDMKNTCSSYYRPSIEQVKLDKLSTNKCDNVLKNEEDDSMINVKSLVCHADNSINNFNKDISTKLEITQFEVIKENLPKSEADKELKISSNSKDSLQLAKPEADCVEKIIPSESKSEHLIPDNKSHVNSENDSSESDTSSSSDSSSCSSSSSSSSSSFCATDTSTPFPSTKKNQRAQNKIYTDTSNDSALKTETQAKQLNIKTNLISNLNHDLSQKKSTENSVIKPETNAKTAKEDINIEENEKSPLKMFSIAKTDIQIETALQETPAKDDNLLEADISETPSSSKAGIESVINLSSKISALENEKILKPNNVTKPEKAKQKPRILDIKRINSTTSLINLKTVQNVNTLSNVIDQDIIISGDNQLVMELEKKRQRMIAKIKDVPKSSNTYKPRGRPRLSRSNTSIKEKRGRNAKAKNLAPVDKQINSEISEICINSEVNALDKKYIKRTVTIKKSNNVLPEKNDMTKQGNKQSTSSQVQINSENFQNDVEIKTSSKYELDLKSNSCIDNSKTGDFNSNMKNLLKVSTDKESVILAASKQNTQISHEDSACAAVEYINHAENKNKLIMKSKVDQVKRDLFSDEENDYKSNLIIPKISNVKSDKNNSNAEILNVNSVSTIKTNVLENPKEELSSVLQCLQLVPASKNDQVNDEENDLRKLSSNNVEYHFVCDENTASRRKRRKNSNQEQDYEIKFEDREGQDIILRLTPYEEIFNLSPKPTKKVPNKKSPFRKETIFMDSVLFDLKGSETKPLATSSPTLKSPNSKLKKSAKIVEKKGVTRAESNKKLNTKISEHTQEDTIVVKSRKRKNSESERNKQNIKRQYTTDPRELLNNLDLDEFLTSVHGPA